jgi:hypothetical protein
MTSAAKVPEEPNLRIQFHAACARSTDIAASAYTTTLMRGGKTCH